MTIITLLVTEAPNDNRIITEQHEDRNGRTSFYTKRLDKEGNTKAEIGSRNLKEATIRHFDFIISSLDVVYWH